MIMLPEWIDSWGDLLRLIVFFQGCFVIGMTLFILKIYWHGNPEATTHKSRHILAVAFGHIVMTFLLLRGVYIGVFGPPYIHWPFAIFFLMTAFAMTDYGLREMLTSLRERLKEK